MNELDLSATWQQSGAFAHRTPVAQVQRPEGLPGEADLNEGGAGHQLLAEDAHVTPALQGP
jgi:hypothetical protein